MTDLRKANKSVTVSPEKAQLPTVEMRFAWEAMALFGSR